MCREPGAQRRSALIYTAPSCLRVLPSRPRESVVLLGTCSRLVYLDGHRDSHTVLCCSCVWSCYSCCRDSNTVRAAARYCCWPAPHRRRPRSCSRHFGSDHILGRQRTGALEPDHADGLSPQNYGRRQCVLCMCPPVARSVLVASAGMTSTGMRRFTPRRE